MALWLSLSPPSSLFLLACSHGEHEHQPDLIGVLLCPHLPEVATAAAPSATSSTGTVDAGTTAAPPPLPRCCPVCSPQCPLPLLGLPPSTVVQYFPTELSLLSGFASLVQRVDPDVLMGWEMQKGALGYVVERSQTLGRQPSMLEELSRVLPPPTPAAAPLEHAFHGAERDKSNPASVFQQTHAPARIGLVGERKSHSLSATPPLTKAHSLFVFFPFGHWGFPPLRLSPPLPAPPTRGRTQRA